MTTEGRTLPIWAVAVNRLSGVQKTAYRCGHNMLKVDTSAGLSRYVTPG